MSATDMRNYGVWFFFNPIIHSDIDITKLNRIKYHMYMYMYIHICNYITTFKLTLHMIPFFALLFLNSPLAIKIPLYRWDGIGSFVPGQRRRGGDACVRATTLGWVL